jgi:hypothetical protein
LEEDRVRDSGWSYWIRGKGVLFGVDCERGSKETADFYARVQMGEAIVMGVNPLLLNAEKAETLRRRSENSDN